MAEMFQKSTQYYASLDLAPIPGATPSAVPMAFRARKKGSNGEAKKLGEELAGGDDVAHVTIAPLERIREAAKERTASRLHPRRRVVGQVHALQPEFDDAVLRRRRVVHVELRE